MLLEAELELCESNKDRVNVLEKLLLEAKNLEKIAVQSSKTGQGRTSTALMAKADRLQAEIALERARTKATDSTALELQGKIELAEKKLAIKRASVKVAEARKMMAAGSVATMKAQVAEARASEAFAKKQLSRFEDLERLKGVDAALVEEWRLKSDAVKARLLSIEGKVAECQGQVLLEQARVEVAQLEVEESALRLKHLKSRLVR